MGRFVSRDPIGYAGGMKNLYGYAFNTANRLSDPFGLDPRPYTDPENNFAAQNRQNSPDVSIALPSGGSVTNWDHAVSRRETELGKCCTLRDGTTAPWKFFHINIWDHTGLASGDFADWLSASKEATEDVLSRCCIKPIFSVLSSMKSPFPAGGAIDLLDNNDPFRVDSVPHDPRPSQNSSPWEFSNNLWEQYGAKNPGTVNVVGVRMFSSGNIGVAQVGGPKLVFVDSSYDAWDPLSPIQGAILPGGNMIHEIGHAFGLDHPHTHSGSWTDITALRDNFMSQGNHGLLPNRTTTTEQCKVLRDQALSRPNGW